MPWTRVLWLGAGMVPHEATHPQGFKDNRHGDVMVVRPLREYMAKEIAFYNHFFNVPTVIAPPLPTKVGVSLGPHGVDPKLHIPMVRLGPPLPSLPSLFALAAPG